MISMGLRQAMWATIWEMRRERAGRLGEEGWNGSTSLRIAAVIP